MPPNTERTCNCEICNWPMRSRSCFNLNQSERIQVELEQQEAQQQIQLELEQREIMRQHDLQLEREHRQRMRRLKHFYQEHLHTRELLSEVQDGVQKQLRLISQQMDVFRQICIMNEHSEHLEDEKLELICRELPHLQPNREQNFPQIRGLDVCREIVQNLKQISNLDSMEKKELEYLKESQSRLNEVKMEQQKFLDELNCQVQKLKKICNELSKEMDLIAEPKLK